MIAKQFRRGSRQARTLLENALLRAVSSRYTHSAPCCPGHAVTCPDWFGMLFFKRRLHNDMQAAIRADEQREVVWLAALVTPGHIENPLRIFEEYIH